MRTEIIYEDTQLLVVYKPSGLATQSGRIGQPDAVSELKRYMAKKCAGVPYIGVVHRLDQPVEGLLVFAKTRQASALLTKQLENGSLQKTYYALCMAQEGGQPLSAKGKLEDNLIKDGNLAKIVPPDTPGAKRAALRYELVQDWVPEGNRRIGLYRIHIDTGRFHQIRVQMSHAGLPLLGDQKYAPESVLEVSRKLGIRGVALCAYRLELTHPVSGKHLEFNRLPDFPEALQGNI